MKIRFVLGPAGSGKTFRSLDEIRRLLHDSPTGAPLLLLAPKQATYQLERRLLEHSDLAGWSRLQVLSFDRLARQILEEAGPVELLSEEGRLMVLRALLRRHQAELRIFRGAARLGGFVHELGNLLREFQRQQIGRERLLALAGRVTDSPALAAKLHDLAILLGAYHDWMASHGVLDADLLPDLATMALRRPEHPFQLHSLWLDGFAEMTPQEAGLLVEVVRRTHRSQLTFCLASQSGEDPPVSRAPEAGVPASTGLPPEAGWLSTWAIVSRTLHHCHARLASLEGASIELVSLPEPEQPDRFAAQPALRFLARHWTHPVPACEAIQASAAGAIEFRPCADAEAEAVAAAREVLRHVRGGGRYREIAVLVRSLDTHQAALDRVFRRYGIPHFLDRRVSLAHHPLAELTRSTLRIAAFQWQHEDLFAALKTTLTPATSAWIDVLENRALASGWNGAFWLDQAHLEDWTPDARALLDVTLAPFIRFQRSVGTEPSAGELAGAIRIHWEALSVREHLESWIGQEGPGAIQHRTAWDELVAWLENLERGFDSERFALTEWIPILEAGLSALTAGTIPPAQDQVLIGAIDRSRQPELEVALVLGLNEGSFPATPTAAGLLSEPERERLLNHGAALGPGPRHRTGHERYFGYIACTRASRKLVLSWSERDEVGRPRTPSVFIHWVRTMFPRLPETAPDPGPPAPDCPPGELWRRLEHATELLPWLLSRTGLTPLDGLAGNALRRVWLRTFRKDHETDRLSAQAVTSLLGREPEISVSSLETLAACPFQFFARHALRGTERAKFEVDARQSGSLAHELLAAFHQHVARTGRRWRDIPPEEGPRIVETLASTLLPAYRGGLFQSSPEARWAAAHLVAAVGRCVRVLLKWMATYRFDPVAVELSFGSSSPWPAWRLDLGHDRFLRIRGKIDRLDVFRTEADRAWFCIVDYKQRSPRFQEANVFAGIDLQVSAYLLAAGEVVRWSALGMPAECSPAGMFFVGLRNRPKSGTSGDPEGTDSAREKLYQHRGRFSEAALRSLDQGIDVTPSGQFSAKLRKDGKLSAASDGRLEPEFQLLLRQARNTMLALGTRLLAGSAEVSPLRLGTFQACTGCDWRSVCRFDPWLDEFRNLPNDGRKAAEG